MSSSASSTMGGIVEPRKNDVLFGRGAGIRMREGNRKFLSIVQEYKTAYAMNENKLYVAQTVLNRVKSLSPPGRFLEPIGDTHAGDLWREVDDDKAIAKIKQALRDPDNRSEKATTGMNPNHAVAFHTRGTAGFLPATPLLEGSFSQMGLHRVVPGQNSSFPPLYSDPLLRYRLAVQQGMPSTLLNAMASAASHQNASGANDSISMSGIHPHMGLNLQQIVSTGCCHQAPLPRSLPPTQNSNKEHAQAQTGDESSHGIEAGKARHGTSVKRSHAQQSVMGDKQEIVESSTRTRIATKEDLDGDDVEAAQILLSTMKDETDFQG